MKFYESIYTWFFIFFWLGYVSASSGLFLGFVLLWGIIFVGKKIMELKGVIEEKF